MESIKKYVITYVYKNIKLDFNIKAESEEVAIRKLNSYLDNEANILEVKIGGLNNGNIKSWYR